MKHFILLITCLLVSACSHMPKLVWEPVNEPEPTTVQAVDLTRQTPLQQGQGEPFRQTHSMLDMARMASNDSIALFPLDGPTENPFANRYPGQNNGFAPTTTTSGGYPVRDPSVVVFPIEDTPVQQVNAFAYPQAQMTGQASISQPTMIVAEGNAPVSLTRSMPVVTLAPPVSAQAPLPTPFTANGGLAPNIAPPQPASEPEHRRTMLTGY